MAETTTNPQETPKQGNANTAPNATLIKNNLDAVINGMESAVGSLDPNQIKEAKEQEKKTKTLIETLKHARIEATNKATKNPKKKTEYFEQFTKQTQEILSKNTDQKFLDESKAKFGQERLDKFHQWIYESKTPIKPDDIKNFVSKELKPPIPNAKDQAEFLRFAQYSLLQPVIEQDSLDDHKFVKAFNEDLKKKATTFENKTDQSWLDRLISILFNKELGQPIKTQQNDNSNKNKTKGETISINGLPDEVAQEILDGSGKSTSPTLAYLTHLGLENGVANNNPNYKFHQLAIQNNALIKALMDQNSALMPTKVAMLYGNTYNHQTNDNWNAAVGYSNANDNDTANNKATIMNVQMHNGSSLIVTGCNADEGIKNAGFFLYHLNDNGKPNSKAALNNDEIKARFNFLKDLKENQAQLDNLKGLVIKSDPNAKTPSPKDSNYLMDFLKSLSDDGKLQESLEKYFKDNPQRNKENNKNKEEAFRPYYESFQKDPKRFINANRFIKDQESKQENRDQARLFSNELHAYLNHPSVYEQAANRNKIVLVGKQDSNHAALITTINSGTVGYAVQDYNKQKDRALDGEMKTTIKEYPKGVIFANQTNTLFTNAAKNPNDKSVSSTRGVSRIDACAFQTVAVRIANTSASTYESINWKDSEQNATTNTYLWQKYSTKLLFLNNKKVQAINKINQDGKENLLGKEKNNLKLQQAQKELVRIINEETKLMREMEKDVEKLNKKSTNPLNDKKNAQQTIKGFMVAFTLKLAESQNQIPVVEKAETAKKEVKDHPQTQNQEAIAKAKEQNQQHQKVEAMIQEQYQDHHVFVSANVKEGEILGKKGSEKLNKELSNAIIAANVSGVKNEQMDNIKLSQTAIQDYSRSFKYSNWLINGMQTWGLSMLIPLSGYSNALNNAMHNGIGYGIDRSVAKNKEYKSDGIPTKTI